MLREWGCQLCNELDPETRKARPEEPRAGVDILESGQLARLLTSGLGGLGGSTVSSLAGLGAEPRKVWILEYSGSSEIMPERSLPETLTITRPVTDTIVALIVVIMIQVLGLLAGSDKSVGSESGNVLYHLTTDNGNVIFCCRVLFYLEISALNSQPGDIRPKP